MLDVARAGSLSTGLAIMPRRSQRTASTATSCASDRLVGPADDCDHWLFATQATPARFPAEYVTTAGRAAARLKPAESRERPASGPVCRQPRLPAERHTGSGETPSMIGAARGHAALTGLA